MKVIKCEMCGSTDFAKEEGMYVCQHCHTKYTVEDAKKMMVEGTVKIDASDKLTNYRTLARRAKDAEDDVNAAKYYDMILAEDPDDWEAAFYSIYYASFHIKNIEISSVASRLCNNIKSFAQLIFAMDEADSKAAALELSKRLVTLCLCLEGASVSFFKALPMVTIGANELGDYQARTQFIGDSLFNWADILYDKSGDDQELRAAAINAYKVAISIFEGHSEYLMKLPPEKINNPRTANGVRRIEAAAERIRAVEPEFKTKRQEAMAKGGCYVATCVYGSYDCPKVWTLRRYRDNTLGATWYGRAFIRTYYAISPTLVKWFGDTNWFKRMWKGKLDRMVRRLQAEGVEDTPYEDKVW